MLEEEEVILGAEIQEGEEEGYREEMLNEDRTNQRKKLKDGNILYGVTNGPDEV